jgi:ubiquinone/menaquinone biosynthesis C-methylase UbiE
MQDVLQFYTDHPDEDRLSTGWGLLEFIRSKEIVERYLPPQACTVLDVGGGTGVYAEWLGKLGHAAHLIDLAPAHIAMARERRNRIASAEVGDARRLAWADGSVDAVLLLGPLYHLVERDERVQALREAWRVLRPGGLLFAAAICRFAPLLGSLVEGFHDDPAFAPVLARDLVDGQHRNTTGDPRRFTTAYFHRSEELADEVRAAGLEVVDCVAIEGPCWLSGGSRTAFEACWSDARRRVALLELARAVERDPMALAASPHLMAIARA